MYRIFLLVFLNAVKSDSNNTILVCSFFSKKIRFTTLEFLVEISLVRPLYSIDTTPLMISFDPKSLDSRLQYSFGISFVHVELEGFKVSRIRCSIAIALTVLTAGITYLIAYWRPDWRLALTHRRAQLADADTVLVLVRSPEILELKLIIIYGYI